MKNIASRAGRSRRLMPGLEKRMMTRIRLSSIIIAALAIAIFMTPGCRRNPKPIVTNGGWAFENGQRGTVADYKGKVVLLDFYATWCDPCRAETPHLVALHQQLEQKGLQIVGLNVGGEEDRAEVPAFAKEFDIKFPLVFPDDEFVNAYLGANENIPQTFVLDRQGNVVRHFVGFSESRTAELERVIQATLAQPN
jgi:thiol-disulfide isomerase/thioredoxin